MVSCHMSHKLKVSKSQVSKTWQDAARHDNDVASDSSARPWEGQAPVTGVGHECEGRAMPRNGLGGSAYVTSASVREYWRIYYHRVVWTQC